MREGRRMRGYKKGMYRGVERKNVDVIERVRSLISGGWWW